VIFPKTILIRVTAEMLHAVTEAAKDEDVMRSQFIRDAIKEHIATVDHRIGLPKGRRK
jgi:metal-responsive CopG/Arc/MetJ family transcriptional regulator